MRFVFGLLGIVLALAIVGTLVKKQMDATRLTAPPGLSAPDGKPASNVREQSQQMQQQYKQQLESTLQQGADRLQQEPQ